MDACIVMFDYGYISKLPYVFLRTTRMSERRDKNYILCSTEVHAYTQNSNIMLTWDKVCFSIECAHIYTHFQFYDEHTQHKPTFRCSCNFADARENPSLCVRTQCTLFVCEVRAKTATCVIFHSISVSFGLASEQH